MLPAFLKMGPMDCPVTSATTSNIRQERGSHSHSGGSLISHMNSCTLLIVEWSYFSFISNGEQPTKVCAVINKIILIIIFFIHSCLDSLKKIRFTDQTRLIHYSAKTLSLYGIIIIIIIITNTGSKRRCRPTDLH